VTFVSGGIMFGINSYVPLFAQGVRGGSAIDAGLIVLPMSVSWPLGSIISGRIMLKKGYYVSALMGACMLVAGTSLMLFMTADSSIAITLVSVTIVGIGMGFMMPSLMISVQNAVTWGNRGVATATTQFFRTIGGSIWVAVMGAVLNNSLSSSFKDLQGVPAGANAQTLLDDRASSTLAPDVIANMQHALATGLHQVYILVFVSALMATAAVLFFPRGRAEELSAEARPNREGGEGFVVDSTAVPQPGAGGGS
jgi:MFS family permease